MVTHMSQKLKPLALTSLRNPRAFTHGLFRFPGRFHPPLVTYLLKCHPDAKIIGDPMVGCGTVAVEATIVGKPGFYSDIDPLCCLLTKAKTRTIDPNSLIEKVNEIIEKCNPFARRGSKRATAQKYIKDLEGSTTFRAPPNVFHWFQPYVVINLCRILQCIAEIERSSRLKDALLAIFASTIRRVSRADPQTSSGLEVTRIRRQALNAGLRFDVGAEFGKKATLMAEGYRELRRSPNLGQVTVVEGDARQWSDMCKKLKMWPDLVITSPCYLSAIEYWRRHRLEYCWLGLVDSKDLSKFHHRFLGMSNDDTDLEVLPAYIYHLHSRLNRKGCPQEAKALACYFSDSSSWLREIGKVLEKTRGMAYVVAGCSYSQGQSVDTPLALQEIAKNLGMSAHIFLLYRIMNYHMQYPTKGKRITSETILKLTVPHK